MCKGRLGQPCGYQRIAGRLSLRFSLYEEGVFCFVYGYFYPKAFVMIVSASKKGKTRQKKEGRR